VDLERHAADLERTVAERTAELRATVGDLEAFSYSISHDLRAPLRAMQGFAKLLQETYGQQLGGDGQMWLEKITRAGARLNQLIEDVLSYSRVGRADLKLEPNSLDELVPRVIEEYPNILQGAPEITVQRPLRSVIGSETLLMQCVANLLGNAVKFVSPGTRPRINILTESRNGAVRLWIEDNGVGIPEAEQRQIFGLFTRGAGISQVDCTGVGLAVVQRAVARMQGKVGVESQVGQGSRFWIELPAAP
jgi:signal transduction histidine kinase